MKRLSKASLYKACNLCIAFASFLHLAYKSFVFFGEIPYPTED